MKLDFVGFYFMAIIDFGYHVFFMNHYFSVGAEGFMATSPTTTTITTSTTATTTAGMITISLTISTARIATSGSSAAGATLAY